LRARVAKGHLLLTRALPAVPSAWSDRVPHDYQRISIDFAGGVAFGSDQGMFIKNGSELQLISANGDVNNNVRGRARAPRAPPISAPAPACASCRACLAARALSCAGMPPCR
jgi:hypothetical protein